MGELGKERLTETDRSEMTVCLIGLVALCSASGVRLAVVGWGV